MVLHIDQSDFRGGSSKENCRKGKRYQGGKNIRLLRAWIQCRLVIETESAISPEHYDLEQMKSGHNLSV